MAHAQLLVATQRSVGGGGAPHPLSYKKKMSAQKRVDKLMTQSTYYGVTPLRASAILATMVAAAPVALAGAATATATAASSGRGSSAMSASTSASTSKVSSTTSAALPVRDDADPDASTFHTDEASKVVFQQYVCRSLDYGKAHPCDVTEAGTLSRVDLPLATYPLRDSLPSRLIDEGHLSALQLEGISYAAERHHQMLSNGTRAGFFLADGAGVGQLSWHRPRVSLVWNLIGHSCMLLYLF